MTSLKVELLTDLIAVNMKTMLAVLFFFFFLIIQQKVLLDVFVNCEVISYII